MWPLKLYDIILTTVLKLEAKANNSICKWLGLPQCLSTMEVFGRNTLQPPLQSISLGYRKEKVSLIFELRVTRPGHPNYLFPGSQRTQV